MSAVAAAFDAAAPTYDADFGANPVGRAFRERVHERLAALFAPGLRVLDVGCGTGEDAARLAARGVLVHGIDPSSAMVRHARARGVRATVLAAEDAQRLGETFDGAYSNFGALNCADLAAAGAALAALLKPGAPVLLSLMPPWPLPATLAALPALARRGARTPRVAGQPVPTAYPTPAQARAALGPSFHWTRVEALGAVAPGPSHAGWAARHPAAFGVLWELDRRVGTWPLLRALGDHVLLEGRRS